MTREQAIELLEKLRRRTESRGATPAEAAQAAELAERIIARYGLDAAATESCEHEEELAERRWPPYASILGMAIEKRFGLSGRMVRQPGEPCRILFIGPEHHCRVACWLFGALARDIRSRAERSARENGLSGPALVRWRNEFSTSAAWRLFDRLSPEAAKAIEARPCVVDDSPPPRKQRRHKVRRLTKVQMAAMIAGFEAGRVMSIDTNVIAEPQSSPIGHLPAPRESVRAQTTMF